MPQAPNWTISEFKTLLMNNALTNDELADLLPQRTPGAIGFVRSGVHSWHTGGDISMLSKIMIEQLESGDHQTRGGNDG